MSNKAAFRYIQDPGHGWLNVRVMDNYQTGWVAEWLVMKPE